MPRSKNAVSDEETWAYGKTPDGDGRSPEAYAELARTTKLRTLLDMSEREICELERFYGCPVIRPKRTRRPTGRTAAVPA